MGFISNFIKTWKTLKENERLAQQKLVEDLESSKSIIQTLQKSLEEKENQLTEIVERDTPDFTAEKKAATDAGEPWVKILHIEVDPENISDGVFELDWNDIFIARLVKSGYHGKNDQELVDQWLNNICGNIVAGYYEQEIADPEKRRIIQKNILDNGRTEIG